MAAAATMLAACSQSDFVNEVPESAPKAIGFETVMKKTTRADETAENSTASYSWLLSDHHESFSVWGHKLVGEESTQVFNGVTVSRNVNSWTYVTDDVKPVYWDKAASQYDFFAVAPVDANLWQLNDAADFSTTHKHYITTKKDFTVESHNAATYKSAATTGNATQSFKGLDNATDLMIAAPTTVQNANFGADVQLNFIHILSRLNVTVTTNLDGVKIKNIVVGNLKSTGKFNETGKFTDDDTAVDAATLKAGTHKRWNLGDGLVQYEAGEQELTSGLKLIAIESLVMPQLANYDGGLDLHATAFAGEEAYLYIEYTINGETYKRAYNLADTFNADGDSSLALNEGWQYTLELTIGASVINFTTNVAEWANYTPGGLQEIM